MPKENTINYIEIPVKNMALSKSFFAKVFEWEFTDYGEDYCCPTNAGIDAGLALSYKCFNQSKGMALIVFYASNLPQKKQLIKLNGGEITQDIFSFPGGKRFHFMDINGNEYAVWSDQV